MLQRTIRAISVLYLISVIVVVVYNSESKNFYLVLVLFFSAVLTLSFLYSSEVIILLDQYNQIY